MYYMCIALGGMNMLKGRANFMPNSRGNTKSSGDNQQRYVDLTKHNRRVYVVTVVVVVIDFLCVIF